MDFLSPTWLLLGLLAIPILLLYMLKLRRREVEVSSTLLWQMLLRDRQANTPWQRLKRSLLLILQLLLLAALVLALARPSLPVPNLASGSLVLLLDASASMNATDVEPSRFEAARTAARGLIADLPGDAEVTLILAGRQPQVLAANERSREALGQALDGAQPGLGTSDWQGAFALAAGMAAAGSSREELTTVILSDGGLPPEGAPPLPGEVRYLPIGRASENLAVRALALRPTGGRSQLFASVTNYGDSGREAILSIYADSELVHAQSLSLPAGESRDIVLDDLPNPAGGGEETLYEARLSAPAGSVTQTPDWLSLDDAAYAVHQVSGEGRALLATQDPDGNLFLEQVLAAMPDVLPFRALPAADGSLQLPDPVEDPFDLYILDGVIPDGLPAGDLLLVDPPPNPLFETGGVFTATARVQVHEHPLTRFLEWEDVHVRQARQVQLPDWAQALVGTEAGPLVFAGETGGRRVGVITFDLHESDLPLQVDFPILMANLVDYLLQSEPLALSIRTQGLRTGEALNLRPEADVAGVEITTPDGEVFPLTAGEDGITFRETEKPGFYTVRYLGSSARPDDHFAVNLFSPLESEIQPLERIPAGQGEIRASAPAELGQRELWPWLAALALAVLLLEWWVYHRRQALPAATRN